MTSSVVNDRLPAARLGTLGLQHVVAMYAGAVAVPLIVGGAIGLPREQLAFLINADLLISGVATLIQCVGVWRFGIRLPVAQGCSFAAVTPMVVIATSGGGMPAVYGAVIVCGLVMVALAPWFAAIVRFFPPLVTGTIITIVGLCLLPVAARWAGGEPRDVGLAATVLVIILAVYRFSRGFLSRVAVLAGIAAGTLISIPAGFTDFSAVGQAGLFGVTTPFRFGLPVFDPAAIASMSVVTLVLMVETVGGLFALGELTRTPIDSRRLADGLRADGLSTALGGVFNTFPYTAYAQNIGLVGLSGVRSRWVVAASGGILVLLGLLPWLGAIVAAIPRPVLGGAGVAMFGTVAVYGIRMLAGIDYDDNHNLLIIATALGIAMIPVGAPGFYHHFPQWAQVVLDSGISTGSIVVIALNLLFNHIRGGQAFRRSR